MKILVLSNIYPPDMLGGYEVGCRQAVEALKARGHEVRVLTSAPRKPVLGEPDVRRTLRLAEIWSPELFRHNHPVTSHLTQSASHRVNAGNVHALLEEIEEFAPDVAYVWMIAGAGGLGLMAALELSEVPWVWHLMDDLPRLLCEAGGRVSAGFAREFERHLRRGRYLACSRQLVDEIEDAGFDLGDRASIVPNWITGTVFARPQEDYLPDGVLRIVSAAGQIDRRSDKGIDLVIESAALLRDRGHANFHVDLYGNVSDQHFDALIEARDLRGLVTLKGSLPNARLRERLSDYDLFAFPTRPREPFAFAPLEAAARGCVPLISQVCGNAEWFVHGVHLLKAPRDPSAFADSYEDILNGRVDLAAIGRRGADVLNRDFHLDRIAGRIEAALADVAGRPRSAPVPKGEVYRLALLAERLSMVLIQNSLKASA